MQFVNILELFAMLLQVAVEVIVQTIPQNRYRTKETPIPINKKYAARDEASSQNVSLGEVVAFRTVDPFFLRRIIVPFWV